MNKDQEKELLSKTNHMLLLDIKSLCEDRIDAKTADGFVLKEVFRVLEGRVIEVSKSDKK